MQVLAMHLGHRSNRLVLNTLITLRNLSDTANRVDHLDELIQACINLLSSNDMQIVAYVLGILSNLTCNNAKNKVRHSWPPARGCPCVVHTNILPTKLYYLSYCNCDCVVYSYLLLPLMHDVMNGTCIP